MARHYLFTAEGTENAEVLILKRTASRTVSPPVLVMGAWPALKIKAGTIGFSILRGFLRALSGLCGLMVNNVRQRRTVRPDLRQLHP
ncbi:hypothetical protein CWE23_04195 [Idiomarina aquatica]|uniref:Uncharacterized protein n=1 Tax=Idiomarina aquatica TaxID=1327752 RepID=A0AA94EHK9_9GAMM|nr:hypothetical protein CWE23_04195 [Idiomarina aquatica]